jgi:nucleoid-associated protein YgaU
MATAKVTHRRRRKQPRYKLIISVAGKSKHRARSFVFPYGPQGLTINGGANNYANVPRPGRFPLLIENNPNLAVLSFQVTVADRYDRSIQGMLANCWLIARSSNTVTIDYNKMTRGPWKCTGITVTTTKLNPQQEPCQATVQFEFTRESEVNWGKGLTSGGHQPPHKHGGHSTKHKRKQSHYTVKRGDTLSSVSISVYGNASRAGEIGTLNHITHPKKELTSGRILKLPG